MPTDKGKDNAQPDTKEDKRHKFINDIDAMIKELRDLTDEVEHDVLKLRQSCSHATISNQNQGQGQDEGASSWSAAPEDVDTDKWHVLDECNMPRNTKLISHFIEHVDRFLCLPEDNTGR
ncbi:hypothetical protein HYE67_008651 [Fusarium culmorum]|uniref:Uncharacterized protein n=1 Tax=Fusarium culmorum TaxID=5516 RepID=A0A7S8DDR0_FUSCU|nr:hypothetical protein HYE67_008651 [Fusarium culmorum]